MLEFGEKLLRYSKKLGFSFKNENNLIIAFTHASYSENNYERLEFLGDSILKLIISDYLFKKYKNEHEGRLTSLRAEIVSDRMLTVFARKLELEKYILTGKKEKKDCRSMDTILACVFEAFLGAIYLEYGVKSFDVIAKFIFKNFKKEIEKIEEDIDCLNPKAILQEYSQGKLHILPTYNLVETTGLEHKKTFKVCVSLNGETYSAGYGLTKKEAQKNAAKNALIELGLIKKEKK